jgi:hypothetical protein
MIDPNSPSFHDAEEAIEVFVNSDREIVVNLPSEVYLRPDVAERFANALLAAAAWVKRSYERD